MSIAFHAIATIVASSDSSGWLLLGGPAAGGATWWGLYRYYRNTDKSHDFEHETTIVAQPVTGSDEKFDEVRRTRKTSVPGDNRDDHRERCTRV